MKRSKKKKNKNPVIFGFVKNQFAVLFILFTISERVNKILLGES
ncbi:hypothetical protein WG904_00035 [Pedobacter sp. Du54]